MQRSLIQTMTRGILICGFCLLPIATVSGVDNNQDSASKKQIDKAWQDSLALLGQGAFEKASSLIKDLSQRPETAGSFQQVSHWIGEFEQLQKQRQERINKDYEKYAQWLKEDLAGYKKEDKITWWLLAMKDFGRAYRYAKDKGTFRDQSWLQEITDGAFKAAQEYENRNEWYEAAAIYYRLQETFPQEEKYRDALDACKANIRLEVAYSPEADWKMEVENIHPKMARDAFRKIASDHIRKPNCRKMAVAALEHIQKLTETEDLAEIFTTLKDENEVQRFRSRVNVHLKRTRRKEELSCQELMDIFDRVLVINREVELFPQDVLVREFVHGTLQPLDKNTDMLWPAEVEEFEKHTQGKFSGVGIRIQKPRNEAIKVISPLPGTPAYRAGIQPGDLITEIEDEPVINFSIQKAVVRITGEPGTYVRLTIKRGDDEFEVKLKRAAVTIHTIKGYERNEAGNWEYMIDPAQKIAYLRLTNFTDATTDELKEHIDKLLSDGMRGLIFDLRNNPGGTLKAAVEVSNMFLDQGKLIVSTKDRQEEPWEVSATVGEHYNNFPIVILVNKVSASAAEIVTGALKVHNRALVVGERTFGKGSVQQVLPLNYSSNAYLKLTTAYYYLPNGRCLHREEDSVTWGVDPDVKVELVPKEIVKISEHQLKTEILKGKDQEELTEEDLEKATRYTDPPATAPADKEKEEDKQKEDEEKDPEEELDVDREDENDYPMVDPQLEAAVLLIRVRLESGRPWPTSPPEKVAAKPMEKIEN